MPQNIYAMAKAAGVVAYPNKAMPKIQLEVISRGKPTISPFQVLRNGLYRDANPPATKKPAQTNTRKLCKAFSSAWEGKKKANTPATENKA